MEVILQDLAWTMLCSLKAGWWGFHMLIVLAGGWGGGGGGYWDFGKAIEDECNMWGFS